MDVFNTAMAFKSSVVARCLVLSASCHDSLWVALWRAVRVRIASSISRTVVHRLGNPLALTAKPRSKARQALSLILEASARMDSPSSHRF